MRKLGIPTVLDRFIQQAVMQVLQRQLGPDVLRAQLWVSARALGTSGGGSRRSSIIAAGYRWVVDLDLEKFFDRVNHDKLMGASREAGER